MDVDSVSVARRRRERRLRQFLRHERLSVAMALSEKKHHTSRGQRQDMAGWVGTSCTTRPSSGTTHPPAGALPVRGSYSARVPRSSLAEVHREFVHHIVEDEADGQEERQDDRREDRHQRKESGDVAENQTHNMSAWR